MKKVKIILASLIVLLTFGIRSVNAASGTISVSSANQVVNGNKLTVTVTISSNVGIGSWQMNLNYDKSYLQLLSATSEAGGTMMANSSATGVTKKSYTFTFKALKTGNTNLSVASALAYAFSDLSQINLTTGSKKVKIITQEELEASYSKDNDLKSLKVEGYDITPSFDKSVLEYSVTVPEDTKEVKIVATANDSRSSISGTGTKDVSVGTNSFDIVVRAENGSEKTYKLKVEVKDNNPIEVSVDNKTYTLVKIRDYLTAPRDFTEETITINEIEIPGYKNENTNLLLVGLKDEEGSISLFQYNKDKDSYAKYLSITSNQVTIIPNAGNDLKGYEKYSETINDEVFTVYKTDKDSRFSIIYGTDLTTGEKGYFMYDSKLKTITAYNTELIEELQSQNQLFMIIIIAFSAVLFILFIIVISLAKKKKTKKEKNTNKRKVKEEMAEL